jgi:hypothetical protein
MGAGVRRIMLLTLGCEDLPKSVSVEGAPAQERLREPVPGVLLVPGHDPAARPALTAELAGRR